MQTLPNQTDIDAFESMRLGNQQALIVLYKRYKKDVFRVAYRILNNIQEAEDLTHDVFLYLSHSTPYNIKRGSMRVFLTTITRTKAIDYLRKKYSERQRFLKRSQSFLSIQNIPIDKVALEEVFCFIRQALSNLPVNQRQILEKSYYDDRSQSEIAKELKIPLGTVKTHKRKALQKLRRLLQDFSIQIVLDE